MSQFRFVCPISPGYSILNIIVEAENLSSAYAMYIKEWWREPYIRTTAIFHNWALVARIVPIFNAETELLDPKLEVWP